MGGGFERQKPGMEGGGKSRIEEKGKENREGITDPQDAVPHVSSHDVATQAASRLPGHPSSS